LPDLLLPGRDTSAESLAFSEILRLVRIRRKSWSIVK